MMRALLPCLLLATASPAVPPPPSPAGGLTPDAIMRAQEGLSFDAQLLIDGQQRAHVLHDGPLRQRQEFLGADGQPTDLVVTDGQNRWHAMPRLKLVRISPEDPPRKLDERLMLIRKNYRFQVMGQTRQAGRVVLLTQFSPVHRGNLTHRLWVDLETHMPLVIERRTEAGLLVDRSEYTRIAYNPRFPAGSFQFRIPHGSHVESPTTMLAQGDGAAPLPKDMPFSPVLPRSLPEGYALFSWQYFLSNTHVPTFNWRFHDGLNMLSLFATAEHHAPKLPADARPVAEIGPSAAFLEQRGNHMLTWKAHGTSYTAVGHLPQDVLVQLAKSTL